MAVITENQKGQSFETRIVLEDGEITEYKLPGVGPLTISMTVAPGLAGLTASAKAFLTEGAGLGIPIYFTSAATGQTDIQVPENGGLYYATIDNPINSIKFQAASGTTQIEIIQRKLAGE